MSMKSILVHQKITHKPDLKPASYTSLFGFIPDLYDRLDQNDKFYFLKYVEKVIMEEDSDAKNQMNP